MFLFGWLWSILQTNILKVVSVSSLYLVNPLVLLISPEEKRKNDSSDIFPVMMSWPGYL